MKLNKTLIKNEFAFLKKYGFKSNNKKGIVDTIVEFTYKKKLSILIWYDLCIKESDIKNDMIVDALLEKSFWSLNIIIEKNSVRRNLFDCDMFSDEALKSLRTKIDTLSLSDQLNEYSLFIEEHINDIIG